MTDTIELNKLAILLKSYHIPGRPLLLANAHDGSSASLVAKLEQTKAIATASYAVAEVQGIRDQDLTLEPNLIGISYVARGISNAGRSRDLPLTADLQDCYEDPADTVKRAIQLGVVGCNIEDVNLRQNPPSLRPIEEAVQRVRAVISSARACGVPDFVVNARTDVLDYNDGSIADVIERGRAFLAAGATTIFVWGAHRDTVTEAQIKELVTAFEGKVAVAPGARSISALQQLGVSRISVGPTLWRACQPVIQKQAQDIVAGTYL